MICDVFFISIQLTISKQATNAHCLECSSTVIAESSLGSAAEKGAEGGSELNFKEAALFLAEVSLH